MMLSPCLDFIFKNEHENFCDRIRAAAAMGFRAVEFHFWRNKPLEAVEKTLAETGVRLTSCLVEPRVTLVDPAAAAATLTAVRESLPIARRLDCPALVVASGPIVPGRSAAEQTDAMVDVLKSAARMAEDAGTTLLLEPVNTRVDHPGIFLDLTPDGFAVIEAVGSPRVRLLYDMYHSTCMGESPSEVLAGRMDLVGHVQIADAPGRGEPGSGSIDWHRYLAVLDDLGYRGDIGLEYRPTGDSAVSLRRTIESLGRGP